MAAGQSRPTADDAARLTGPPGLQQVIAYRPPLPGGGCRGRGTAALARALNPKRVADP
jgi:hypothetical protein